MTRRATEETLDGLHAAVAKVLIEGLQPVTVPVFDKEGKKTGDRVENPSPQMIAQAIKFLQANGIDTPAASKRMNDLTQALNALDDLDPQAALPN